MAAWTPTQDATITPFTAEQYPHVFKWPSTTLRTVSPDRTFWEKVTILHKEAFRPKTKNRGSHHRKRDKCRIRLIDRSGIYHGRGRRIRTLGTRFWRPLLYQLSYTPKSLGVVPPAIPLWWAFGDSNPGPIGYEPTALTN